MQEFPWQEFLKLAVNDLKISPTEFWKMTPLELINIAGINKKNQPAMNRTELNILLNQLSINR